MTSPWQSAFTAAPLMGPITALEFDPAYELLWATDNSNMLHSFSSADRLYSSFPGAARLMPSISFLDAPGFQQSLVAVPDRDVVRCFKRGGMHAMCFRAPAGVPQLIENLQVNSSSGALLFTGGNTLTRLRLTDEGTDHVSVATEAAVTLLRTDGPYLATAGASGLLTLWDERTLAMTGQVAASRSRVLALDVHDHMVLAAFSERTATGVLKVFDARNFSAPVLTVGDIPSGNLSHLRYMRGRDGKDSACLLASRTYHIARLDTQALVHSSSEVADVALTYTALAVSPSSQWAAIGTDKGSILTFTAAHEARPVISTGVAVTHPEAPKFASAWEEVVVGKGFDEDADPQTLASAWPEPNYMILSVPHKLSCVQTEHYGLRIPNTWDVTREQSYQPDSKEKLQAELPNPYPFNTRLGDDPSKVQQLLLDVRKNMKHKTSRAGVYAPTEDTLHAQFKPDWSLYNEQPHRFVGLDNSFPECWITPILQCLYNCHAPTYPVRKAIMSHLCKREYCLTCEIAFIFSNMFVASQPDSGLVPLVQVGNLVRTMYQIRNFSVGDIFAPARSRDEAVAKMHAMHRLILERLHSDLQDQSAYAFPEHEVPWQGYQNSIASFFATRVAPPAGSSVVPQPRFSYDVPPTALKVDEGLQHLLKQLEQESPELTIESLPPILVLLLNPEHSPQPLKTSASLRIQREGGSGLNYLSNANITHVADNIGDAGNFVSHQRSGDDTFTLINDYRVTAPKRQAELERMMPALSLCSEVVTYYTLSYEDWEPAPTKRDGYQLPNLWETLGPLLTDDFLARPLPCHDRREHFRSPLASFRDIRPGDLVAIDAEYVNLRWSPRETDGVLAYAPRKPHMGLARLSCILSTGDADERTIVDDYVHTPEEIEDYVTQFSGIHPGDLDITSTKNLTTLKATYLKLRALVDRGVKFVGHGLTQDFRVCNISVPKSQIIDTLEIFRRNGSRYLALRFLAYHVLGESVQESEHDSVEDARTSLRLYRRYLQLQREGKFEQVIEQVVAKGLETNWYVPERAAYGDKPVTPPAALMGSPVFKEEPSS